jgi:hypothetical protein
VLDGLRTRAEEGILAHTRDRRASGGPRTGTDGRDMRGWGENFFSETLSKIPFFYFIFLPAYPFSKIYDEWVRCER